MSFVELIIEKITNKIIAWQEFDIDRKDAHDWTLQEDRFFERITGELPQIDELSEIHRYLWDPIKKTLSFISGSKTLEEEQNDKLSFNQADWEQKVVTINQAKSVDDLKTLLLELLGDRP